MKRIIIILTVSLSVLFPKISDSQTDEIEYRTFRRCPKGFRGINWATKIDEIPNMIYRGYDSNNKDITWYTRKNDKMEIGNAKVKNIFYLFFEDRFYYVKIEFKGKSIYDKIGKMFEFAYGQPRLVEPRPHLPQNLKKTWPYRDVGIKLYFDADCFLKWSCKGEILYTYLPISSQVE
jgi:hypothetical protein